MDEVEKHERLYRCFADQHVFLYTSTLKKDGKSARSEPTFKVVGIENFSITRLRTPDSPGLISLSCMMKYLGSRSSSAAIFPGSRVRVAENNNFWHEIVLSSVRFVGNSGSDERC